MGQARKSGRTFWCALVVVGGCGAEPINDVDGCAIPQGALVITEIHANPDGKDEFREYVELRNVTDDDLSLLGSSLTSSRADDTGAMSHRFGAVTIAGGDYLVVGNAKSDALPVHVDYSYGSTLGNLRNSDAKLSLSCGSVDVDTVEYARTKDGHALELDGGIAPDASANDQVDGWCFAASATIAGQPGDFGSPGIDNSRCETSSPSSPCTSQAGAELEAPQVGQARITEWMANPKGSDSELEWVEVLIEAPANLKGLRLRNDEESVGRSPFKACFPVDAGTRVVFGASPGAAPRVDADLDISLGNTGMQTLILSTDDVELDRVTYEGTSEGRATQIDTTEAVCSISDHAEYEYAQENFGTPGECNVECPAVLGDGMCLEDGVPRDIRTPTSGGIRITEWLASPATGDARGGEWVELHVTADVDLNGLTWADRSGTSNGIVSPECIAIPTQTWLVFARSEDPLDNGGLPRVDHLLPISLNNADETISISLDGETLDAVDYTRARSGVAQQVDESGKHCEASLVFGTGDLGTPGAPNSACP